MLAKLVWLIVFHAILKLLALNVLQIIYLMLKQSHVLTLFVVQDNIMIHVRVFVLHVPMDAVLALQLLFALVALMDIIYLLELAWLVLAIAYSAQVLINAQCAHNIINLFKTYHFVFTINVLITNTLIQILELALLV